MCIPQSNGAVRRFRTTSKYHHTVQHDYHDHAYEDSSGMLAALTTSSSKKTIARGGVTTQFPEKLHELLDTLERDGHSHIISWQPHGRCFVVHKPKEFVSEIMPTYFKQSRYASFQRQLNLYGFLRLTKQGPDKSGYYHEWFLKGKPELSRNIQRCKVKGTGVRAKANPDTEPDFYSMPFIDSTSSSASSSNRSSPVVADKACSSSSIAPQQPKQQQKQVVVAPTLVYSRPLQVEPETQTSWVKLAPPPPHDDDVLMFEGMPFHYLDPFAAPKLRLQEKQEPFTKSEMEDFLQDLHLPPDLYHDIVETVEGDSGLGHLLERIIE